MEMIQKVHTTLTTIVKFLGKFYERENSIVVLIVLIALIKKLV